MTENGEQHEHFRFRLLVASLLTMTENGEQYKNFSFQTTLSLRSTQ
ncbi:MAG: hypothetical protein K2G31_03860 [Clostridia bacterium]|nr:hypothetical protein [Clostridia bacterium]